jgi:hypothetical protein
MQLDPETLLRLALESGCDPRTIRKAWRGEEIRGRAGVRARNVLINAGYLLPQELNFEPKPIAKVGG